MESIENLANKVLKKADMAVEDSLLSAMNLPFFSALRWVERQTHTRTNHAQMLVGLREGLFLKEFVVHTQSVRILEIGTFTGYSLLCLSEGVRSVLASRGIKDIRYGEDTRVDAIELNPQLDYLINGGLQKAGTAKLVKVCFGDALTVIPEKFLDRKYDLVFIDANKRQYSEYYNLVYPLVEPEGYILADNVIWYGKVNESANLSDSKSQGIAFFNKLVESDQRTEKTLLNIRDGLYIVKKLKKNFI